MDCLRDPRGGDPQEVQVNVVLDDWQLLAFAGLVTLLAGIVIAIEAVMRLRERRKP